MSVFQKGIKMNRAEKFGRGMMGRGMETTGSFHLIPLPNIPLPPWLSATQRFHSETLAQEAEMPRLMVEAIFITRNPRKH
jgi:hypothetical protein